MSKPTDLVQGTLDLLILKVIALEPMHGWAIAQRISQMSNDVLQVGQGSLYPALHKLEQQGWIEAEWRDSENNRRAKYYTLTKEGRRALKQEAATDRDTGAALVEVSVSLTSDTGTPQVLRVSVPAPGVPKDLAMGHLVKATGLTLIEGEKNGRAWQIFRAVSLTVVKAG